MPLRVSFARRNTDLPISCEREYGTVFSIAINKYFYVTVKRHGELFNVPIRLKHSETELVERVDDVENYVAPERLLQDYQ